MAFAKVMWYYVYALRWGIGACMKKLLFAVLAVVLMSAPVVADDPVFGANCPFEDCFDLATEAPSSFDPNIPNSFEDLNIGFQAISEENLTHGGHRSYFDVDYVALTDADDEENHIKMGVRMYLDGDGDGVVDHTRTEWVEDHFTPNWTYEDCSNLGNGEDECFLHDADGEEGGLGCGITTPNTCSSCRMCIVIRNGEPKQVPMISSGWCETSHGTCMCDLPLASCPPYRLSFLQSCQEWISELLYNAAIAGCWSDPIYQQQAPFM